MKLANFKVGEGPEPVVLLHGFLGSGANLCTLARRWSEAEPEKTFLLPDLTGHGESPAPPPGTTLEAVARDVMETADAEGLSGPMRWTGHSFGGRVGLAAARIAPERVSRIDLLDISPGAVSNAGSESGAVLRRLLQMPAEAADRATMKRLLMETGLSSPLSDWLVMNLELNPSGGVKWRFDREALGALHGPVLGEDLWDVVEAKRIPIRCARGARSGYVPPEDAARMKTLGVEVIDLPSGHFVHVEALDALLHWLRAVR